MDLPLRSPVNTMPSPPSKLADEIRETLLSMAADGSWSRYEGAHCERLREALRAQFRVPHVTLCCSGTIAVELALRGVGVGVGDEVILAGYDFPGNFRAIEAVGARPVLADIEADSWCLDADRTAEAIGPATRAIICSHLHGTLASVRRLRALADARGLVLVEDTCQVPGAIVDGQAAGSWGHVAAVSFGGSKLLTAGRGGAVLATDPAVPQRIKVFADRGNEAFPLSELQAAVLLPQLRWLAEMNIERLARAERLRDAVSAIAGWRPPRDWRSSTDQKPAFYKIAWWFEPTADSTRATGDPPTEFAAATDAAAVAKIARNAGLPLDTAFRGFADRSARRCRKADDLHYARRAAARTLLLHHTDLPEEGIATERLADLFRVVAELSHRSASGNS
ncbi:MAG: DegT/DnrJ/EryC1/StrS family aminotransferase [Planctomycetota bacterium]